MLKISYSFIPFPREIVDDGLDLTLGEYRLLGYLIRHTVGFRVNAKIAISQEELLNGKRRPDGTRADRGCGLSGPRHLIAARKALVARGWLAFSESGDGFVYELVMGESGSLGEPEPVPLGTEISSLREPLISIKEVDSIRKEERDSSNQLNQLTLDIGVDPKETPAARDARIFLGAFSYFVEQAGKNPKIYLPTNQRKKKFVCRLEEARQMAKATVGNSLSPEKREAFARRLIQKAIDAMCDSDWHREKGHQRWEVIFDSSRRFQNWLDRAENPPEPEKRESKAWGTPRSASAQP